MCVPKQTDLNVGGFQIGAEHVLQARQRKFVACLLDAIDVDARTAKTKATVACNDYAVSPSLSYHVSASAKDAPLHTDLVVQGWLCCRWLPNVEYNHLDAIFWQVVGALFVGLPNNSNQVKN